MHVGFYGDDSSLVTTGERLRFSRLSGRQEPRRIATVYREAIQNWLSFTLT